MRTAFNEELLKIARKDKRIFLVLADIGYGEIEPFAQAFPNRFRNSPMKNNLKIFLMVC